MSDPNAGQVTNDTQKPKTDPPVQSEIVKDSAAYKESHAADRKQRRHRQLRKAPIWIGAVCSVALVVITGRYTYYTGRQLDMYGQQMGLQKRIARAQVGVPQLAVSYLDIFHQANAKSVGGFIQVANSGKTNADNVTVAMNIDFRDSAPEPSSYRAIDLKPTNPTVLQPSPPSIVTSQTVYTKKPISPSEYAAFERPNMFLYAWGVINYEDFTELWYTTKFCKFVSGKDVLSAPSGSWDHPWTDCPGAQSTQPDLTHEQQN